MTHGIRVPTEQCWRCHGKGHLGKLPSGAPLIDRVCHGSGRLPIPRTIRGKLRAAWEKFVAKNVACDDPWEDVTQDTPTSRR